MEPILTRYGYRCDPCLAYKPAITQTPPFSYQLRKS
jgi:hypothetical protein